MDFRFSNRKTSTVCNPPRQKHRKIENKKLRPTSQKFPQQLNNTQMNYLLGNITHPSDLNQNSKSLKENKNLCEYCGRELEHSKLPCCDKQKLHIYLLNIQKRKTIQSLSSYSMNKLNADNIKCNYEKLQDIHKNIENSASSSFKSLRSNPSKPLMRFNLEKYRGTFKRIEKKMRNIEKFYPELYNQNTCIIDLWAGFELQNTLDDEKLEYKESKTLWK